MKIHSLWLSASVLTLACYGVAGAQTTTSSQKDDAAAAKVPEVVVTVA